MPEGRLIKKKAADDYRLNAVDPEAELLFYKLIFSGVDREGRLKADPKWINNRFFSLRNFLAEQVEEWLQQLAAQRKKGRGLIELYEVEGQAYLFMPGFEGEQSESWRTKYKYREAESSYPPPPANLLKKPSRKRHNATPTLDGKVAMHIQYLEEKFGRPATVSELEQIKSFADTYPDGWFEKAIDIAVVKKAYALRYVEVVLENARREGKEPSIGKGKGRTNATKEPTEQELEDSITKPLGD